MIFQRLDKKPGRKTLFSFENSRIGKVTFARAFKASLEQKKRLDLAAVEAAKVIDRHFVNLYLKSDTNVLGPYSLVLGAIQKADGQVDEVNRVSNVGQLLWDYNNEGLRYNLFQEATIEALLPKDKEDIELAERLQDNLPDILYTLSRPQDRSILIHRFAEAYVRLKATNRDLHVLPKDVMKRLLYAATLSQGLKKEFQQWFRKDVNDMEKELEKRGLSQDPLPSAARSATLPQQQQQHAAPASLIGTAEMQPSYKRHPDPVHDAYRPPHSLQVEPSHQHGHAPVHAGSGGYPFANNPNLRSDTPYSSSTSSYAHGNAVNLPSYGFQAHGYTPFAQSYAPDAQSHHVYLFSYPPPAFSASDASLQAPADSRFRTGQQGGTIGSAGLAGTHQPTQRHRPVGRAQGEASSMRLGGRQERNLVGQLDRISPRPAEGERDVEPANRKLGFSGD
ncbi:hypothetical protein ACQY0O_005530 [Thecaphora frezii]